MIYLTKSLKALELLLSIVLVKPITRDACSPWTLPSFSTSKLWWEILMLILMLPCCQTMNKYQQTFASPLVVGEC
jgi:hypothetical protein